MNAIQKIVKRVTLPHFVKEIGCGDLLKHLTELNKSQFYDEGAILRLQKRRLKKILVHAFENTTFYRKRFNECGFNPYEFKELNQMKKITLLSKNEIRDNLSDLIADNIKDEDMHSSETGGTTGVKMKFYRDNSSLGPKEAALYRFEQWAGWDFGLRKGIVWPALQDYVGHTNWKSKVKNELYRREVVFPAAILDPESMNAYIKKLERMKPVMVRGFTSPLVELARQIKKLGLEITYVKGVITTGEPLYRHQRQLISQAFNCPVYDSYRSRECGPVAQECEKFNGLHINAESLYVEIVSDLKTNRLNNGFGEIVISDLWNYGMPLIRYRTGDMGIMSSKHCTCGRGLPMLEKVCGRTPDIFYTPDKRPIAAITLVLYLVDEAPGMLGQVQIIQDRLDHLVIRLTPDPPPTEEIKNYQRQKIKELMGSEMRISYEIVDTISREQSGKYLFTKCLVEHPDC